MTFRQSTAAAILLLAGLSAAAPAVAQFRDPLRMGREEEEKGGHNLSGFYLGVDASYLAGEIGNVADESGSRVGGFLGYGLFPLGGDFYVGGEAGVGATFATETNLDYYIAGRLGVEVAYDTLLYVSAGWLRNRFDAGLEAAVSIEGRRVDPDASLRSRFTKDALRAGVGLEFYLLFGLAVAVEYVHRAYFPGRESEARARVSFNF